MSTKAQATMNAHVGHTIAHHNININPTLKSPILKSDINGKKAALVKDQRRQGKLGKLPMPINSDYEA